MQYRVDRAPGQNPHINYEPSSLGGLQEATRQAKEHQPHYNAKLTREKIDRPNDFKQAGETYRAFGDWERDELISNLVGALSVCKSDIQERMIGYFTEADPDYGMRVANGLANACKQTREGVQQETENGPQQAEQMGHESDRY